MFASGGFSWFRLIPGVDHNEPLVAAGLTENLAHAGGEVPHTAAYLHAWLAVAFLIGFALLARLALVRAQSRPGIEKYFASESPSVLAIAEVIASGVKGMMGDLLGQKDVRTFFPLIAGLLTYIFCCNIQSIIPGFMAPTDAVATNVGMALVVFLTFNFVGLSRDFWGYLKHLAGPSLILAPFMFAVETLSLLIRPYSLTLRLAANMFGDHAVFTTVSGMIPILLPAALLGLAVVVSGMQAFVFSLLTVIYLNLSLPHHAHDDHADGHHA
jgi:F-type H+-transporting ATPase subunit a